MHPFFSVTLFTGQQLVLEAVQRWLQRPCADAEAARQRRTGLKGLLSLLLRTAATGLLATVLDAAIEFRRRQLLAAAAAADDEGGDASASSRFPGLCMLSRAGVAAWKARLLLGIDELERRAEAYGIESRRRFSPGKPSESDGAAAKAGGSGSGGCGVLRLAGSAGDLAVQGAEEEGSQRLSRTVEQLQQLVKQGDAESEQRLDAELGSLVDLLLGTAPLPSPATSASRSRSVPACLDRMGGGASADMRASRSRAALAAAAQPADGEEHCGGGAGSGTTGETCHICMDRLVRVQVSDCRHDLCFTCARQLCAGQDHQVPQCPYCRQPINGFVAIAGCGAAAAGAEAEGEAATACA